MNRRGMNLGLTLSWYSVLIGVVIFIVLFFTITGWIIQSQKTFFIFGGENEIEVSKHISCEKELNEVLFSFLNLEVVIDEKEKSVSEAIEDSTLSVDLFDRISEDFFGNAFPGGILEEELPGWKVRILDFDGRYIMKDGEIFENGGMDCYEHIVSEIIIGDKKINACMFKPYCEELR